MRRQNVIQVSYYLRWWIHWIIVHASNSETYYQRWHDLLSTLVGWRSNELLSTLLYSETYCLRCMTYCLRWWNWPPLFEYLLFDHSAVRVVDNLVNHWISNAEQSGIVDEPLPTFESAVWVNYCPHIRIIVNDDWIIDHSMFKVNYYHAHSTQAIYPCIENVSRLYFHYWQ